MKAGELWAAIKKAERAFLEWRREEARISTMVARRRPFKQGHLHLYNRFLDELVIVDYRILGNRTQVEELTYDAISALLQIDHKGFATVPAAYQDVRSVCESIDDGAGFNVEIADQDDDPVYPVDSRVIYGDVNLVYPPYEDQKNW